MRVRHALVAIGLPGRPRPSSASSSAKGRPISSRATGRRSSTHFRLAAGVRIYERRAALLHAKTALIDGVWSSVGSTNLDWRSFVHNYEADVIVLAAPFGRDMQRLFALDVEASHEITLAEWQRRGLVARAREWFARRWEYLL